MSGFAAVPISDDGRVVGFRSEATNLVPHDTNGLADVFVHDRLTGETLRVSGRPDGTEANGESLPGLVEWAISGDGRTVTFDSKATNLLIPDSPLERAVFVREQVDPALCDTPRAGYVPLAAQGEPRDRGPDSRRHDGR